MSEASRPVVYIVEDDSDLAASYAALVETMGVGYQVFLSGESFLDRFDPDLPGCAIVDLRMPGISGLQLLTRLRAEDNHLPVVMLTAYADVPTVVQAIRLGATDFLEKPVMPATLIARVRDALKLDQRLRSERSLRQASQSRIDKLTEREVEVLEQVIAGRSSKQIAYALNIALKTVEKHRTSLMRKLNASNASELVRIALEARGAQAP